MPQMVWKTDLKGNILYANKKFLDYVGKKATDQMNVFAREIVHPDDYEKSAGEFERASKEKSEFTVTRRLKSHNGQYKTFVTKGIPVLDDAGNPLSWYGTCTVQQ